MGLALIVLSLSSFLIGRKDLADLRTTRGIQEELEKTSILTAKLLADKIEQTFRALPAWPTRLAALPDLDLDQTLQDLKMFKNGGNKEGSTAQSIQQAELGLELQLTSKKKGIQSDP